MNEQVQAIATSERCRRCNQPKGEHKAANISDGQMVGQMVLICPTSTFEAQPGATGTTSQK